MFCKALVGALIRFLITQNGLKIGTYEAGIREGSRAIFSKCFKQTITHPFPMFSALLLYL
jgi:hypothetical protein